MARPKRSIEDRIADLSEWDENHLHRLWKGGLYRGKPNMAGNVHPVRHLLGINTKGDHAKIFLRAGCLEPLCINEHHFTIIRCNSTKEGRKAVFNDPRSKWTGEQEEEIAEGLQDYRDTGEFSDIYSDVINAEIRIRAK